MCIEQTTTVNRRRVLLGFGLGLAGLSGCLDQSTNDGDASTGTTTPPSVSAPTKTTIAQEHSTLEEACNGELEAVRHWRTLVVEPGPMDGFELTTGPQSVSIGGTLDVELSNVASTERTTGPKADYDIQHRAPGGWQSIFRTDQRNYVSPGISHPPGDGFTWEISMTRRGLTQIDRRWDQTNLYVCEPLEPGTYRFVYWGVAPPVEFDTDGEYAIGKEFTVTG